MDNHAFCRILLRDVMADVRKRFTPEQVRAAWVYNTGGRGGRSQWEFHGPAEHFDHNLKMADCAWSAKAEGWRRLLEPAVCIAGSPTVEGSGKCDDAECVCQTAAP